MVLLIGFVFRVDLWVVKAPDACQGVNLKLLNSCEEMLECERGMGGRTVQKYIETPLLYSRVPMGPQFKFDLRVWVLVTSVHPLQAHVYNAVYGRLCSKAYSAEGKNDNDAFMHFTNFSINKKVNNDGKEHDLLLTDKQVRSISNH